MKAKVDAPSLDDGQQWTLSAGRRQTMVVRGKRLWDGTVVTLGPQKAVAIELLPGANGVIATFDCLQEPEGPAMLQAWTSEGVTSPVSVAVASSEDGRQCAKENTRRKPRAQQARAGLGAP